MQRGLAIGSERMDDVCDPLVELFRFESHALLASIDARLEGLRAGPVETSAITRLRQDAHTLGGLAATVGHDVIREESRRLERALEPLRDGVKGANLDEAFDIARLLRRLVGVACEEDRKAGEERADVADAGRMIAKEVVPAILVVDDSRTVLRFVQRALEGAGYRVFSASTEAAAAELIRNEAIALVLLDLSIVARRPTDSLFAGLRESGAKTPIVLFSNRSEEELRDITRRAGAAGFSTKTPDAAGLVKIIESFVPRPSPGRAEAR